MHDALEVYWKSNYPFNTYIPKIFEKHRIIIPPREYIDFYIFIPIGTIASIYFLIKGNFMERVFSLMLILETGIRLLYFSAFLHYVIFWLMTAIMLTIMFLRKPIKYRTLIVWLDIVWTLFVFAYEYHVHYFDISAWLTIGILIIAFFSMYKLPTGKTLAIIGVFYLLFMGSYSYLLTYRKNVDKQDVVNGHEYAFRVLTPCDYALNGYYSTYNLKAKDPGYYAILLGQIDVLGEKAGVAKRDNLNELIRTKMPKIISTGVYWDTYWEQRGKNIPAHKIDEFLVNTYYEPTGIGDIYVLKPQYQHHNCVYNGKEWKFMD
jgi:hypothetical protein